MDIPQNGVALTPREREVLTLIGNGLSDGEIAESLVLTVGTVKWYNQQIYNKLGVSNRTSALVQAQRAGLLSDVKADKKTTATLPILERRSNLPAYLTSFVGRESELAHLRNLLKTSRLLTLTGSPGTGKTRLALQLASEVQSNFEDGVFVVSLAPVRDPERVVTTIAQAVGVVEAGKISPENALKQFLSRKHLLLLLDNFEHLLSAAERIPELLNAAPRLNIVVTSREVLRLYGEVEFSVPPLQLPDLKQFTTPDTIRNYEAVTLFVQRAQSVTPSFSLNEENASSVAAICVHLDGLPLAIELAAARTRLYAPQTLLVRLGSRLQALTDGPRDAPARQKTLRDTLTWSYDLLDTNEKILFSRLGIFAGCCTLEAALELCGDPMQPDIVVGIESLLNKSLLRRVSGFDGEPRLIMLETMREFALEKLDDRGEMAAIRERHGQYFLTQAERAAKDYFTTNETYWMLWLEEQHDNMRTALRWSLEADKSGQTSLSLIAGVAHFWEMKGHFSEARSWMSQVLALDTSKARTKVRADALFSIGVIAYFQSDYNAAQSLYQDALVIYRELGNERGVASAVINMGVVAVEIGDYDNVSAFLQEGYSIMKAIGNAGGVAWALTELGFGALRVGDYEQAQQWLEEGLTGYQAVNERVGEAQALSGLGEIALRKGNLSKATELLEASLTIRREIYQKWGIAASLGSLAWVAILQGDNECALKNLKESLDLRVEMHDAGGIAWCLEKLAAMALDRGQASRAVTIFGGAAALRESVDSVIEQVERPYYEQRLTQLHAELSDADFQRLWNDGKTMSVEDITAFALALPEKS